MDITLLSIIKDLCINHEGFRQDLSNLMKYVLLPWKWDDEKKYYYRENLRGDRVAYGAKNAYDQRRADDDLKEQGYTLYQSAT